MRIEYDVAELPAREAYQLLGATVIPRPIAWVSTQSAAGADNLAPHSFFTIASSDPPIVQFTSIGAKDTLANVLETGEFVVHTAPAGLIDAVNATSARVAHGVDEFDLAGLPREPSSKVRPMRVAAAPAALECVLHDTLEVGNGVLVLGRVVHLAIDRAVLAADGLPDALALAPLARLGRDEWAELGTLHRRSRPQ